MTTTITTARTAKTRNDDSDCHLVGTILDPKISLSLSLALALSFSLSYWSYLRLSVSFSVSWSLPFSSLLVSLSAPLWIARTITMFQTPGPGRPGGVVADIHATILVEASNMMLRRKGKLADFFTSQLAVASDHPVRDLGQDVGANVCNDPLIDQPLDSDTSLSFSLSTTMPIVRPKTMETTAPTKTKMIPITSGMTNTKNTTTTLTITITITMTIFQDPGSCPPGGSRRLSCHHPR